MSDDAKLVTYLKYFDIEPSMETFQERKKIQKLVYLMQEVGLDANYGFSWYLYGPYSPKLTRTLFDIVEQGTDITANVSTNERERLQLLKSFLGQDINSTRQLELIASLLYLKRITKGKVAVRDIIVMLREKKPQFSEQEVASCWQRLETLQASTN